MLKFLVYCILAYIVFRFVSFWRNLGRSKAEDRKPPARVSGSGVMVKDEVCQTYLPRENALREIIDGEEKFFCSSECRRKCLEAEKKRG
ncbi:MAG: hypothetical protein JW843_02785 [Candidatus Aminicenantes bacterium]|nr:hypothetical protein [Candidatus Aminicenantes bacterium]